MKPHGSGIKREPPAIAGRPPKKYTWLSEDRHCDVCVTGGGLTGAMCALFAAEAGLSAVLITSEGIGFGDTGHLTGCARFDAGRTLSGLDRIMSVDDALKLYSLGLDALDGLENLCGALDGTYKKSGVSSGFERRDLLVFTDTPTELALMESEYLAIRKKLPQCTFVTRKTAESSFGFPVSGGLMTSGGSAVLDPYLLAHMCLMRAEELGAEIFEQTAATDIQTPGSEDQTDLGCRQQGNANSSPPRKTSRLIRHDCPIAGRRNRMGRAMYLGKIRRGCRRLQPYLRGKTVGKLHLPERIFPARRRIGKIQRASQSDAKRPTRFSRSLRQIPVRIRV